VLLGFVMLVLLGSMLFPPGREPAAFAALVGVLCVLLVAVCCLKGEPPRWRWGGDKRR